jgi:hypothetical protein
LIAGCFGDCVDSFVEGELIMKKLLKEKRVHWSYRQLKHVEAVVELFQVFLAFRLKNWNSLRWILLH